MKSNIGKNLKAIRLQKGLTQSELGKKMDVDARTISSWETDRTEPKIAQVQRLCNVLNCEQCMLTGINEHDYTIELSQTDKTILELYHNLSAEDRNSLLLYMISLQGFDKDGD